jgi:hypothetical protein
MAPAIAVMLPGSPPEATLAMVMLMVVGCILVTLHQSGILLYLKEAKLTQESHMPVKMPPHIAKLAPKREDYPSEEAFQEAKDHFIHRIKHLLKVFPKG